MHNSYDVTVSHSRVIFSYRLQYEPGRAIDEKDLCYLCLGNLVYGDSV